MEKKSETLPQPFASIYGIDTEYLLAEAKKVEMTKKEGKHTYREIFYEFFNDIQEHYIQLNKSPKTLGDIEGTNRLYVLQEELPYESIADCYVEELTPSMVKKFKNDIFDYNSGSTRFPNPRKKPLTHKTLRKINTYIDKVFYYAYDHGYVTKDFIDNIKIMYIKGEAQKSKTAVRNFFSKKEFDHFMEVYDEYAYTVFQGNEEIKVSKLHQIERDSEPIVTFRCLLYRAFFNLAFYTGMRKNEIRGLQWSDILPPDNEFPLSGVVTEKQYTDKQKKFVNATEDYTRNPKTRNSVRICTLHQACEKSLNELRQYLIINDMYDENRHIFYDFYCRIPKPIPETTLERNFTKFKKLSGIEESSGSLGGIQRNITIHGLRHSACTMLLEQGMSIKDVASFLGHADTKMAEYVYNHIVKPRDLEKERLQENLKYFME